MSGAEGPGSGGSPEVRVDRLTGLRTILAPGRAARPDDFARADRGSPEDPADCPFCEGHEARTPAELYAVRPGGGESDGPGWVVRSVPNLYPVLADRGHEVIVHAPRHATALADLDAQQFGAAVGAWRERMRAHSGAAYTHLIVNEGPAAGASREHTHAQLFALDFVPPLVERELGPASDNALAAEIAEELDQGGRVVASDDEAVLYCPWASRSPFELRLAPRQPAPRFEQDADTGTALLHSALRLLDERLERPQLNLWVRTAPRGTERFHWHIDILPRLTIKAGFELGTGVDINVYPPERAAADLRGD